MGFLAYLPPPGSGVTREPHEVVVIPKCPVGAGEAPPVPRLATAHVSTLSPLRATSGAPPGPSREPSAQERGTREKGALYVLRRDLSVAIRKTPGSSGLRATDVERELFNALRGGELDLRKLYRDDLAAVLQLSPKGWDAVAAIAAARGISLTRLVLPDDAEHIPNGLLPLVNCALRLDSISVDSGGAETLNLDLHGKPCWQFERKPALEIRVRGNPPAEVRVPRDARVNALNLRQAAGPLMHKTWLVRVDDKGVQAGPGETLPGLICRRKATDFGWKPADGPQGRAANLDAQAASRVMLNCRLPFAGHPDQLIECRHLVQHWVESRIDHHAAAQGRYSYAGFKDEKALSSAVDFATEARWEEIERHLAPDAFPPENLGAMLAGVAQALKPGDVRHVYLETDAHVCAIELRKKTRADGTNDIAIVFYDPNDTASHMRAVANEPAEMSGWTLDDWVGERRGRLYCGPAESTRVCRLLDTDGSSVRVPQELRHPPECQSAATLVALNAGLQSLPADMILAAHSDLPKLRSSLKGQLSGPLDFYNLPPALESVELDQGIASCLEFALAVGNERAAQVILDETLSSELSPRDKYELVACLDKWVADFCKGLRDATPAVAARQVDAYHAWAGRMCAEIAGGTLEPDASATWLGFAQRFAATGLAAHAAGFIVGLADAPIDHASKTAFVEKACARLDLPELFARLDGASALEARWATRLREVLSLGRSNRRQSDSAPASPPSSAATAPQG